MNVNWGKIFRKMLIKKKKKLLCVTPPLSHSLPPPPPNLFIYSHYSLPSHLSLLAWRSLFMKRMSSGSLQRHSQLMFPLFSALMCVLFFELPTLHFFWLSPCVPLSPLCLWIYCSKFCSSLYVLPTAPTLLPSDRVFVWIHWNSVFQYIMCLFWRPALQMLDIFSRLCVHVFVCEKFLLFILFILFMHFTGCQLKSMSPSVLLDWRSLSIAIDRYRLQ